MLKEAFKDIYTVNAMKNRLGFIQSVSYEHQVDPMSLLIVTDAGLDNCQYVGSCGKNGGIDMNYFQYGGETKGIAACVAGSDNITPLTDSCFVSTEMICSHVWKCIASDGTFRLILKDKLLDFAFDYVDILKLNDYISFIECVFDNKVSLICADSFDSRNEFFFPNSREEFDDWFRKKIFVYGVDGRLEDISVSGMISCHQNVIQTIFGYGNFMSLNQALATA